MSVATSGQQSIFPKLREPLSRRVAVPTFTRSGTATRVNANGLIELVAPNLPRLSYVVESGSLVFKGLLREEARTNLLLYSGSIGADGSPSIWVATQSNILAGAIAAPDGTLTGARVLTTGATGRAAQTVSGLTNGNIYALSCYLQAGTSSKMFLTMAGVFGANIDLAAQSIALVEVSPTQALGATLEAFGSGWFRATLIFQAIGPTFAVQIRNNSGVAVDSFYVWGAMLEDCTNGEYASTSYIPTTSTAVSRGADVMTVTNTDVLDTASTEGSLYVEFAKAGHTQRTSGKSLGICSLNDGAGFNYLTLYHFTPSGSPAIPHVSLSQVRNGSSTTTLTDAAAYTDAATDRIAAAWGGSTVSMAVNGGAAQSGTNRAPSLSDIDFGCDENGTNALNGYLRRITWFDDQLSAADLVTLSGGGTITTEAMVDFDFTETDLADQMGDLDLPRILWDDQARDGTVTASSEAPGYPGDAPQRIDTYERWQPAAAALPATWAVDLGSAQFIDACGIAAHDLGTRGCSVKVQMSGDGGNWIDASDVHTPTDDGEILLLFSPQLARYWRLYIAGVGSPTEVPTIGVIQFGPSLVMQRTIYGSHMPITLARQTDIKTPLSKGGNVLGQNMERSGFKSQAEFRYLTADWYRENFDPFVESARRYPYFFSWRPESYPDEVAYCWTESDIRPANMGTRNFMQVTLPMVGYDGHA